MKKTSSPESKKKAQKKVKVVVTGGTGFIGKHLVTELQNEGFDVHIIDSKTDVTNINAIRPILKNADYVFHLASLVGERHSIDFPNETNTINIDGTINMLTASKEAGVKKFIFSSTSAVYGNQDRIPHTENMMVKPQAPYGAQKYIGELYCKIWSELYGLPTVSLRYFSVYGPRESLDYPRTLVIDQFLKNKKENKSHSIIGKGSETRDFVHVSDVIKANILAMKSKKVGKGEVINIGTGKNTTIKKLAQMIGGTIKYIPSRFGPKHTLADISTAKKLLGWKPNVTLEEGVAELKKIWDVQ